MDAGPAGPGSITIGMCGDRLSQPDVVNGFLLDGFPAQRGPAEELDAILAGLGTKLDVVLELVVGLRRGGQADRRTATVPQRQHAHLPRGLTRARAGRLRRLRRRALPARRRQGGDGPRAAGVYERETAPIVAFYAERGLLSSIDATARWKRSPSGAERPGRPLPTLAPSRQRVRFCHGGRGFSRCDPPAEMVVW